MTILISRGSKQKRVEVPEEVHLMIAVLKVFFPDNTPVRLGKYTFKISEIDPWPPKEQTKMF